MRYRISTLLIFALVTAIVVTLAASFFAQPNWLMAMRGKNESDAVAIRAVDGIQQNSSQPKTCWLVPENVSDQRFLRIAV